MPSCVLAARIFCPTTPTFVAASAGAAGPNDAVSLVVKTCGEPNGLSGTSGVVDSSSQQPARKINVIPNQIPRLPMRASILSSAGERGGTITTGIEAVQGFSF